MKNKPILSVIVCTTGAREELRACLGSLKQSDDVEVLVVVNSNKIVKLSSRFKQINENIIGLSHARNTGWKKATGGYIAYIDDDSVADKDWIKNILLFIKNHPKVEVFGGPYKRHSHRNTPSWLPENFGILDNGNKARKIHIGPEWLSGTNMILKKKLLEEHSGFDPNLGMSGNNISYGEETDLQIRLSKSGVEIWYDPKIKVSHLLDDRKMNIFWIIKDSFIRGRNNRYIKNSHNNAFSKSEVNKRKHAGSNLFQTVAKAMQLISYAVGDTYERISA